MSVNHTSFISVIRALLNTFDETPVTNNSEEHSYIKQWHRIRLIYKKKPNRSSLWTIAMWNEQKVWFRCFFIFKQFSNKVNCDTVLLFLNCIQLQNLGLRIRCDAHLQLASASLVFNASNKNLSAWMEKNK